MDFWQILRAIVAVGGVIIGFGLAGHTVFWLLRYIAIGKTDERTRLDELAPRIFGFIRYVLGQAKVIREFGGFLHFFIFWGFMVLQAETIEYIIRGVWPEFRLSMVLGQVGYNGAILVQDIFGLLVLIAVSIAAWRRFVKPPKHIVLSMDANVILGLIGGLMITKYLFHGAELAHLPGPEAIGHDPIYAPVAAATAHLLADGPFTAVHATWLEVLATISFCIHLAIVFFFANYIPRGKHPHLIGAMPNTFFRRLEPQGALYPIDLEDETAESFGAGKLEDLSWKQLLDTYACTECARCEHYCPAFATGKELNPMMVIHKLKDHIKEKGERVYKNKEEDDYGTLAGSVITKEELWACTTCGACVSNCPVFIEHVDTIIDMRRYMVLTEADIPAELSRTFRNIENNSNPWGVSNSKRAEWADGLDIPLLSECETMPDYLFFVGCAGSFDDRQKKVTIATAKILNAAGVSYAILGKEEQCTGDPARRAGNEYLYWMQATANIETMNGYGVTRVITTCPHCFHTIAKEYPQLGGHYEVIHHTELINDLLDRDRLRLRPSAPRTITYHDSCYIGRWNGDYDNPRQALAQVPGVELREMELSRRKSFCCGAGGARMWMEEDHGKRVNVERTDQALRTEAEIVAVACPFCMTMLDDGLKQRNATTVQALDIAEIIVDSLADDSATDEAPAAEA